MKNFILVLLMCGVVSADTTFFDNPLDFFIMTNTPENVTPGGGGGGGGSEVCNRNYTCTDWTECLNNSQTRTCSITGIKCLDAIEPNTTQSCTVSIPDNKWVEDNQNQICLVVVFLILFVLFMKRNKR